MLAPVNGASIGSHAYFQFETPLLGIGSKKCATRGPKSLAGLIAYPVVPPMESPIAQTRPPTKQAPKAGDKPMFAGEKIECIPITRIMVPNISLRKFAME